MKTAWLRVRSLFVVQPNMMDLILCSNEDLLDCTFLPGFCSDDLGAGGS
jgi:hypothetical protein